MKMTLALALLAPIAAAAGPYDQPYAIIDSEDLRTTDLRMAPVRVSKVDGKDAEAGRAVVAPGRHSVTLALGVKPLAAMPAERTVQIDVKPCYRYVFRAQLEASPGQEWQPKIRRKVPLADCLEKFGLEKPRFTGPSAT